MLLADAERGVNVGNTSGQMHVGFDDCKRELLNRAGGYALSQYHRWRIRPGYGEVVAFVENFTHRYLYELTPAQVRSVARCSQHALGNVQAREAMDEVEDCTTPFAYQHLFHCYVEQKQSLPTWQEFGAWLKGPAARLWLQPLMERTGWHCADTRRREQLGRAYRWRAGKAYYSSFREVDLLARLRTDYGLPVRYHVLADVLLGTDFWLRDALVCVYFPNEKYRSGGAGRKPHPSKYFAAADPPFSIMDIEVERQGFGKFWLVSNESVERVAQALNRASNRPDRN